MTSVRDTTSRKEDLKRFIAALEGVKVGEVPAVISAIGGAARWCLFGIVLLASALVYIVGYNCYPLVHGAQDFVAERERPRSLSIGRIEWASEAQKERSNSWSVPVVYFLEEQAQAVVAAGTWTDALPVFVETEKLSTSTAPFELTLTSPHGKAVHGYAYHVDRSNRSVRHIPLPSVVKNNDDHPVTIVSVPRCEKGDSLLFLLLVSSTTRLPDGPDKLAPAIQIALGDMSSVR